MRRGDWCGLKVFCLVAAVLLGPQPAPAQAQAPAGPIRILVGASAGGSVDLFGRAVAQGLAAELGADAFVENRPGAGGNTAVAELARSKPDGLTIGMITVATHGINPALYGARLPFDPVNDFAPISLIGDLSTVLVVHPSVPAKTVAEFVAYLKANPGQVLYGSSGVGTSLHLSGALFSQVTGGPMHHVPYRGVSEALPDLLAGRIQAMFSGIPEVLQQIRAGRLRALVVPSRQRSPLLPDVPTMAEAGYPSFNIETWFGLAAPKGTPASIVDRYNAAIRKAMSQPDVQARLAKLGIDLRTDSPEQFADYIKAEIVKWAPIVKASGATVE
jgi:tripartite-type tricarboxylate transporter receptor subunit TctC